MAEAGQPCDRVLHQLNAVQGALHATMGRLISSEVQICEAIIMDSRSSRKRIAQLKRLHSLYAIINQRSHQPNEVFHE
jgi:DNA-binding FrmR family transcriptional regulator